MEDNKVTTKQKETDISAKPKLTEMLDRAVDILKNHVPYYGDMPYKDNDLYGEQPDSKMDSVSPELKQELNLTLISAAKFIRFSFDKAIKDL